MILLVSDILFAFNLSISDVLTDVCLKKIFCAHGCSLIGSDFLKFSRVPVLAINSVNFEALSI